MMMMLLLLMMRMIDAAADWDGSHRDYRHHLRYRSTTAVRHRTPSRRRLALLPTATGARNASTTTGTGTDDDKAGDSRDDTGEAPEVTAAAAAAAVEEAEAEAGVDAIAGRRKGAGVGRAIDRGQKMSVKMRMGSRDAGRYDGQEKTTSHTLTPTHKHRPAC